MVLEDWCKQLDDWGFPPHMDHVKAMALVSAGQWAEEEDNPDLAKLRKYWIAILHLQQSIWHSFNGNGLWRIMSSPRDYLRKLQHLLWKHGNQSSNMYNLDETQWILGYSAKAKVICRRGKRPPRVTQDRIQELVTVIECCSTGAVVSPSYVIFKGAEQYMGWLSQTPNPDTVFALCLNGWTDDELGVKWIKRFETHTSSNSCPQLHKYDGHRSHLSIKFCQYALAYNIILFCFPVHSTHHLQPLDVGVLKPLPHYYGKAADDHMQDTQTGIVKGTFWWFYSIACTAAYTANNIKAVCRKTGIFPFNPD